MRLEHLKRVFLCICCLVVATQKTSQAADLPFKDTLVQPPQLNPPERGSVTGSLSGFSVSASDVARGSASVKANIDLPSARGSILADVFPTYGLDAGLSEWGMGWQTNLSITRFREVGTLDYESDDFQSPWGILTLGTDGSYYPKGKAPTVVANLTDGTWKVETGSGQTFLFRKDQSVDTPFGTYRWMLSEVQDVNGDRTVLHYSDAQNGKRYVETVEYGGRIHFPQYKVTVEYEALTVPVVEYRSGTASSLEKRISKVTISAREGLSEQYLELWHYTTRYQESDSGPAFYLVGLTKTFATGASEPEQVYEYSLASEVWTNAGWEKLDALNQYISQAGPVGILPDKVAYVDVDEDGLVELEHFYSHILVRRQDDKFVYEFLPNPTGNEDALCRPRPSNSNLPRTFAHMDGGFGEPHVVATGYGNGYNTTKIVLCNRAGNPVYSTEVSQNWRLGRNVRIADLNRDNKPEFIRTSYGGYEVLENLTTEEDGFQFVSSGFKNLEPALNPETTWVQDMNGDGNVDLVVRYDAGVVIYWGAGPAGFSLQGTVMLVLSENGTAIGDLPEYQYSFVDANRDGFMDVLLTRDRTVFMAVNMGTHFEIRPLSALVELIGAIGYPVIADLSGRGDVEVAVAHSGDAYALRLTLPKTGLMTAAYDGKGTRIEFSYARPTPVAGVPHRPVVLSGLVAKAAGIESVPFEFEYAGPVPHTQTKSVRGFEEVHRISSLSVNKATFQHDDDLFAVPLGQTESDTTSAYYRFSDNKYDSQLSLGLRWWRPKSTTAGVRNLDDTLEMSVKTEFKRYEREHCAVETRVENQHGVLDTIKTLVSPAHLNNSLHCLSDTETITGTQHQQPNWNFEHSVKIGRNELGQVETITSVGDTELLLQDLSYDDNHRLSTAAKPGFGTTILTYDPVREVLEKIQQPDGVVIEVTDAEAGTDLVRSLTTQRGTELFVQSFRYDNRKRLEKSWDSFSGASEVFPSETIAYRDAALDDPGAILAKSLIKAGSVQEMVSLIGGGGQELAQLQSIDSGLLVSSLSQINPNTGESTSYVRDVLVGSQPLDVKYADLLAGAQDLSLEQKSGLGDSIYNETLYQADVYGSTATDTQIQSEGLVTTQTENDTFTTRVAADAQGAILWRENQAQDKTTYSYDALGRLRCVTLADGQTQHCVGYDSHGRLNGIWRDGIGGITHEYEQDTTRLHKTTYYDRDENSQREVVYDYDSAGRTTTKTYSLAGDARSAVYSMDYDGVSTEEPGQVGFLTRVLTDLYERTESHNPDGSLRSSTVSLAEWRSLEQTHEYYIDGSQKKTTYTILDNAGNTLHLVDESTVPDSYGRPKTITWETEKSLVTATMHYSPQGQLEKVTLNTEDNIEYDYDPITRHLNGYSINSPSWHSGTSWTYDNRGFIDTESSSVSETTWTRDYVYDPRGYLDSTSGGLEGDTSYAYDSSGLPLTASDQVGTRDLARGAKDGIIIQGVFYNYDKLGRLVRRAGLRFQYGAHGHLASATTRREKWQFVYDEQGNRVLKLERDTPVAAYFGGMYLDNERFVFPVKINGALVGVLDNGEYRPVATDQRGSRLSKTDGSPDVATAYGARASSDTDGLAAALDFVERGYDADLQTVRFGVRDYDPVISQWLTPDPLFLYELEQCIVSPLECNLYSYSSNNPATYVDPNGLQSRESPFAEMYRNSGIEIGGEKGSRLYKWRKRNGYPTNTSSSGPYQFNRRYEAQGVSHSTEASQTIKIGTKAASGSMKFKGGKGKGSIEAKGRVGIWEGFFGLGAKEGGELTGKIGGGLGLELATGTKASAGLGLEFSGTDVDGFVQASAEVANIGVSTKLKTDLEFQFGFSLSNNQCLAKDAVTIKHTVTHKVKVDVPTFLDGFIDELFAL